MLGQVGQPAGKNANVLKPLHPEIGIDNGRPGARRTEDRDRPVGGNLRQAVGNLMGGDVQDRQIMSERQRKGLNLFNRPNVQQNATRLGKQPLHAHLVLTGAEKLEGHFRKHTFE